MESKGKESTSTKHQIKHYLIVENEGADAGRDDRARLARLHPQARIGTDNEKFIAYIF